MTQAFTYNQLSALINNDLHRIEKFREIPDDLITLKPDPTTWSASETLQHIFKFNQLYLEQMDSATESNKLIRAQEELFKPRFIYRRFIRFLEPPYKIKIKTFAPMYPDNSEIEKISQPVENLIQINRNLLERIEAYHEKQLDLDRIRGRNPILQWVRMSLSEFILVLEAHQRRHFWQIEQTLLKLSGKKY